MNKNDLFPYSLLTSTFRNDHVRKALQNERLPIFVIVQNWEFR